MKVQVWSDFRCSFCYIGKRHLETAFQQLGKPLELEYMSYELEPDFVPVKGENHMDKIGDAKGLSKAQQKEMFDHIIDMASQVGLHYDNEALVDANSFKAHKILQYAKQQNKAKEFADQVFSAHFEQGLDIASDDVLATLATSCGLDEAKVRDILTTHQFDDEVRYEESMAQQMQVRGVPFFVLDDKVSLSGAQPIEVMKQAIAYTENLE